ncbi:interferon lambda-4-like [Sorex fumeus]|uniref:interferon lambda-4-like n=1 Tax=Sorex fumeus TaxID=62283 RepID=UPI0024AE6633|nr:interferon lambda-4-like [Sorex fumeus]
MRRRGEAAAVTGLWVLVAVGAAGAAAGRCILSHYRTLEPRTLAAVRALRDHHEEEMLSWTPRNCSFRPRRLQPPPSGSCRRLPQVARDIAEAQAVLINLQSPERIPGIDLTLELLAAVARDVAACLELVRPGSSKKVLRPRKWHLKAQTQLSPRCHRTAVVFNLLRLLVWDLRLVAHSGPCL